MVFRISYTLYNNNQFVCKPINFHALYFVDYILTLTVNGTKAISLSSVEPFTWNTTDNIYLYLGKSTNYYYSGYLDEVKHMSTHVPCT